MDAHVRQEDEEVLDELFDRIVATLDDGVVPVASELLSHRPDLRVQVEELITLARDIAGGASPAPPELPGYTVLRKVGQGGMGAVYLARQERLGGRTVALKLLPPEAASARSRARFEVEAAALARLRHANIVTVHELVAGPGCTAFAMEWIDGCSLADVIRALADEAAEGQSDSKVVRSGSRSAGPSMHAVRRALGAAAEAALERSYVAFIARIGLSVARALAVVHAAGLLHRDVKPSNILLRRDGTPLLSDFGLVRDTEATLTQPGGFAGTPAYAPPEQLRGETDKLDVRSDVYALGATLYHALCLRLPFAGRNPEQLLRQTERGPQPPRKLNPRLPPDLQTIVSKALEPDPARRYASAAEMADDLERLLNLQPIRARPAGLLTRSIKLVRRNRGAFAGAVAGGLAALAVAALLVTYFVLVPRWVAEHTRAARLALLDPGQANNIVSVLYWGRINRDPEAALAGRCAALDSAVGAYDAALRLAPLDATLRQERDTVAAARRALPSAGAVKSQSPGSLGGPPARRVWAPGTPEPASVIPDPAGPAGVNPGTDPRTAGLFAYLCDDYDTAIREWTRFEAARDPLAPPDPLVSAALGVLYLFEEQPARAYPRLRDAVRAFPDVGFLTLYLADAAVKCGDAEDAGLLLERAGSQPRRDPFGGELRVRAAILAAGGDLAGADALYRSAELRGPGWLEHARLMERVGREDEAICRYLGAAELGGPVPLRAYREALERWWRSLPPAERLRNIRASLDLPRHDPRSLATRLRVYAEGAEGKGAFLCRLLPSSCLRACVPACLFWISTTLFDALSSPSLQSLSLSELAKRMEVEDMSLWSRITSFPRVLKELHFTLWRWPGAPGFARRMDATASMIRQLFSARGVRRALTSAVLVAGTPTVSAQSKHYDASLGTLPQAQGWTLTDTGESPAPVVAGGALHQGPTSGNPSAGYQFWGRNDQAISFADGFVLEARLRVISSNFVPDTPEHWVVGYSLEAFDSAGQFIALGIASDGVGLTSTGSFAPTDPLVPFDTTDGFHTYRMVVVGGSATLYVDGVVMATGAPGQLSDQNNVRFGDLAHLGTSETELEYVAYGGLCTAAPCFQGLGDLPGGTYFSIAGCLSSNGTTVGGGSATAASASAEWNHEAFIWRADTGMVYLGDLPGASNWGHVLGLSADGEIAVGASASGNGDAGWERREAFRWTEATGMVALGDLGGGSFNSEATEISDDGALVAGWGNAATGWHAATWSSATGWVDVDPAGPHGRFLALSRNGEWAVGDRGINNNVARRWSAATGLLDLGIPAGSSHAYPYAVSDDGETVVGAGYGATRAFIWTPADGMQGLDDLPGGLQANQAIGMTRDGRLIVGDGTSDLGLEAVLWDESRVVHRVSDVLAANGVGLPPGWILRSAYDVVINGSEVTLCGYGDNPQGHTEAWIARFTLPAEPCPGDVDADGDVDLDDLLIVLGAFAQLGPGSPGDADGDGDTDLDDLLLILGNFGQPCD